MPIAQKSYKRGVGTRYGGRADPGLDFRNHLEKILPLAKKCYKRDMIEGPILDTTFTTT